MAVGESVFHDDKIKGFEVGCEGETYTSEIHCIFRRGSAESPAVEVIDTPGFAGSDTRQVYKANLAMLRDLIRKLVKSRLRIHRVLYFLPYRGPLKCADGVLQ